MLSWLDSILAVPTIGAEVHLPLRIATNKSQYLTSFFDQLGNKGELIDLPRKDTIAIRVDNYVIAITNERLQVSFSYRLTEVKQPGAFPNLDVPKTYPFSELLQISAQFLLDVVRSIEKTGGVTFTFIGIVADMEFGSAPLPPGIEKFLNHISKPWGNLRELHLEKLTTELSKTTDYNELCHHKALFNREKSDIGFILKLDWQRVFNQPVPLAARQFGNEFESCKRGFFKYCEKFAEGNLDYV